MRLSDELSVGKDAIMQQINQERRRENYKKTKSVLSDAQKKRQSLDAVADPQRVKNMRAAKAEDTILITLFNNAAFYKNIKDKVL
jgi:hypothetical protein